MNLSKSPTAFGVAAMLVFATIPFWWGGIVWLGEWAFVAMGHKLENGTDAGAVAAFLCAVGLFIGGLAWLQVIADGQEADK